MNTDLDENQQHDDSHGWEHVFSVCTQVLCTIIQQPSVQLNTPLLVLQTTTNTGVILHVESVFNYKYIILKKARYITFISLTN